MSPFYLVKDMSLRYWLCVLLLFFSNACTNEAHPPTYNHDKSSEILFSTPKNIRYIYAPIVGQSNASEMYFHHEGIRTSGTAILERTLSRMTSTRVISALDRNAFNIPTVNGSTVDGDNKRVAREDRVWWYPDKNEPGIALLKTLRLLQETKQRMETSGTIIHTAIIWMHGENSAAEIAGMDNMNTAATRHLQATSAIFDYIKNILGPNTEFYMVLTPLPEKQAALNYGESITTVEKLYRAGVLTQHFQRQLVKQRSDTHLAVDTNDLQSAYDTGDIKHQKDYWHFSSQSLLEIGRRLAHFIAGHVPIKPKQSNSPHPVPWK